MKNTLLSFMGSILLLFSLQVYADWWNEEWKFQKKLDVDISALDDVGSSKEFPVLIKLSGGNFQYFMDVLPKGSDLRFVAADQKTALDYHIEKFDPIAEIALIWVEVSKSGHALTTGSVTTETIYMYYGNPTAVAGGDSANTYDVNQALVYHFDTPEGPRDASAYQNQPATNTSTIDAAGIIGSAARFQSDQALQIPATPSLQYTPAQGYSASVWISLENTDNAAHLLTLNGSTSLAIALKDGALIATMGNGSETIVEQPLGSTLQANSWHQLGFSISGQQSYIYIDGKLIATLPGIKEAMSPSVDIGFAVAQPGFVGMIDELQLTNVIRNDAWFKRAYDNQAMASDIVVFGGDESVEAVAGETESYFVTILSDVSLDGRIVIFLLGLMAASSAVVVTGKGIMLLRVKKDNNKFLSAFKNIEADFTAIDREQTEDEIELQGSPFLNATFGKHDHYQSSNLYHLYHVAVGELKTRVRGGACLSVQSLAATKATLDAAFVREQQVLNKSMVMLTIAISGGPFLGLLGTVLGVMITFAAIATSGEVDINAIAPGVAAALMTTVAGLAVAIPALFAYNFLSTRIRDMTIDMRVFVDELLAKIAEYHS